MRKIVAVLVSIPLFFIGSASPALAKCTALPCPIGPPKHGPHGPRGPIFIPPSKDRNMSQSDYRAAYQKKMDSFLTDAAKQQTQGRISADQLSKTIANTKKMAHEQVGL